MLWIALSVAAVLLAVCIVNRIVNRRLRLAEYTVRSSRLPAEFDGFRILVAADLHNTPLCERLLALVDKTKPDIVCFAGDMVYGGRRETMEEASRILDRLTGICPVYGVSGNHEAGPTYDFFADEFAVHGGIWLDDAYYTILRNGEEIRIAGVRDRPFIEEETAESAAS